MTMTTIMCRLSSARTSWVQRCKGSQCAAGLPDPPTTEGTWAVRGQGQRAQWEIRKRSSMGNQETELIGKSGNWAQWGIRNDVILWTLNAKHWQGLRRLETAKSYTFATFAQHALKTRIVTSSDVHRILSKYWLSLCKNEEVWHFHFLHSHILAIFRLWQHVQLRLQAAEVSHREVFL